MDSVEAIVKYLQQCAENHPLCQYIGRFNHLEHTRSLPQGQVDENILAAENILLCFGLTIPEPASLAMRPRSIGVCETPGHYIISYMETPMPMANSAIAGWLESLKEKACA